MQFPENDDEFKDSTIAGVEVQKDGTFAILCDGWHLWCGEDLKSKPKVGQTARQYGRGRGATVRGLFIDGEKVWYRTPAEEVVHNEVQTYGADAAEWLSRWDSGRSVWSIEMGGIGPGYEQCIQLTAAEILRWLIEHNPERDSAWPNGPMKKIVLTKAEPLGLSGAQWGAALNLAEQIYFRGPREALTDPVVADRKIMVSKNFPALAAA